MKALLLLLLLCSAPAFAVEHAAIARGRYLVDAGDCAACHTAPDGKPFAGGRAIPTPFGAIYSTNITPDKETGIGAWSDDDFYRAMHEGIGPAGKHFYPAFPYPWYTKLSREDVGHIRAYLSTLQPVHAEGKRPDMPWPFTMRSGMAAWNALFFKEGAWRPDPNKSAQWNRGGYLVEGLGHCGACHTDKNFAGAPKKGQHLQGGYGENWYATSLSDAQRDGLGDWTLEEIAEYLKTGSNAKAASTGPMAEVIENSTQHLSQADLLAIATYLKDGKEPPKGRQAKTEAATKGPGADLYLDQCAGCHMRGGEGQPNVFPPLKGNSVVQAKDPETVIHMILDGARVAKTGSKPTGLAMPAFGGKLTDRDVAELATFLRNSWGNEAGAVSVSQVSKVRASVAKAKGG